MKRRRSFWICSSDGNISLGDRHFKEGQVLKEEKKKRRFGIKGIIIVVLLIILLMVSLIQFFTDWMWLGKWDM